MALYADTDARPPRLAAGGAVESRTLRRACTLIRWRSVLP